MKLYNKKNIQFTFKISCGILLLLFFACQKETKTFTEKDINIIPKPTQLQLHSGGFNFSKNTSFVIENEAQKNLFTPLLSRFKKATGWSLSVVNKKPSENYVSFITDKSLPKEGYQLEVSSDHVHIKASTHAGFIYGLETIRQLLPPAIESNQLMPNTDWTIPNLSIQDQPRFAWRGLMLDLSRHFFGKEYIMKTIDRLAMYKMNVLHLHLVDDQGWRIEIKQYPKLTEVGAWRVNQENKDWNARRAVTADEKGTYGGFLTQKELKEVVRYAQQKNVEIIPEIELPAHVSSAIAAYPDLACFEHPKAIGVPSGGVWPITDIYCAGKESTFEFLENVLTEVMAIFPSKYIHIGGDEATKTNWKKCPFDKKRMKAEGLNNVEELQSYFVKRIEKFLNEKGKRLIGWDEILEGGLAPEATVMSWRGVKGGIEAAKQGHDVIMSPNSYCYFDHYQGPQGDEPQAIGGYTPLSKVYEFDPVVSDLSANEAKHILGGQANLWSEYIPTTAQSEYMLFPRLAALSETLWSMKASRNWENFARRITSAFKRYDYLGIHYAKSAYLITAETKVNLENKTVSLGLANEFPHADIRYVLGKDDLKTQAIKYKEPIKISKTTRIQASLFKDNQPVGKPFVDTIKFHKAVSATVKYLTAYNKSYPGAGKVNMVNSLRGSKNFHDGQWQAWLRDDMKLIIDLKKPKPISSVTVGTLEQQGPDIYFPTLVEVFLSNDNKTYTQVGRVKHSYQSSIGAVLKDFKVKFAQRKARYIKVKATNMKRTPKGTDAWLFVDEIVVD